MDEHHELMNVRVIRVTTEAAMLSAPQHAEAHRRQASQFLDNADERSLSSKVRAEIQAVRRQLNLAVGNEDEEPAES